MDLKEIVNENLINLDMKAKTKKEAIEELTESLYQEGKVRDREAFVKDVYIRESEGKTGLGKHIAIPHGKSDAVAVTSIAFGRTKQALAWETPDDQPVHVILLFAVRNADKTTLHLKLLAQVAVALADDAVLEKLLKTTDKKEVLRLLAQRVE